MHERVTPNAFQMHRIYTVYIRVETRSECKREISACILKWKEKHLFGIEMQTEKFLEEMK